jgi:Xaa-Pro aminopeptidase
MERASLDTIVAHTYGSIRHLTGGWYSVGYAEANAYAEHQYAPWLIINRDRPQDAMYLCSDFERIEALAVHHPIAERCDTTYGAGFITRQEGTDALLRAIHDRGYDRGRIGVELPFMPASVFAALQVGLSGAAIANALPLFLQLRAVKTAAEVALIASAAHVAEVAIERVLRTAAPGVTGLDLEREALLAIASQGAVPTHRYILQGVGPGRSTLQAGIPTNEGLVAGDVVLVDLGAKVEGMPSDLVRMGSVGETEYPVEEGLAVIQDSHHELARWIEPGLSQRDVFAEAKASLAKRADRVVWGTLVPQHHGLGWTMYEPPFDVSWQRGIDLRGAPIDPYDTFELGMTFNLETHIESDDGRELYCSLEDTYVLTEKGCDRLTSLAANLIVM